MSSHVYAMPAVIANATLRNTDTDLAVLEQQLRELADALEAAGVSVDTRSRANRARNELLMLQREVKALLEPAPCRQPKLTQAEHNAFPRGRWS